jgi:hypothetical protein
MPVVWWPVVWWLDLARLVVERVVIVNWRGEVGARVEALRW